MRAHSLCVLLQDWFQHSATFDDIALDSLGEADIVRRLAATPRALARPLRVPPGAGTELLHAIAAAADGGADQLAPVPSAVALPWQAGS